MIQSAVSEENRKLLVELARSAPPGPIVEVGVWKGGSAFDLYQLCQEQDRRLLLFDSFRGMPVYTAGVDAFRLGTFMVDRNTPNEIKAVMPEAEIFIGLYPSTHPAELRDVAFIHCDCDQYLSYKAVIEHMWPLVVDGGMMLFDDYPYLGGAQKAVDEAFSPDELHKHGEHFFVMKGKMPDAIAASPTLYAEEDDAHRD